MANSENHPWNLESFLDSLVVELDKAQDTLAIKAVNRPLTYSVKDVSLDLQIFPSFDGDVVRFTTARPGQSGASRISISLGSITDRMIRETTPEPPTEDDVSLDELTDIDDDTRKGLVRIGVKSAKDVERMQRRNIKVTKVGDKVVDYGKLADVINRSRRATPQVRAVSLGHVDGERVLHIHGENLAPFAGAQGFPIARINDRPAPVAAVSKEQLSFHVGPEHLSDPSSEVTVALDRYAVIRMRLNME